MTGRRLDSTDRAERPTVPPTERDSDERPSTGSPQGTSTEQETYDLSPAASVEQVTDPGTGARSAGEYTPDTEPCVDQQAVIEKAQLPAGDATVDTPGRSLDRDATASFELDPILPDTERTLPPSAKDTGDGLPRIAGYELLEVLGVGGMGIVYKARQPRLDRFVALKMIRAGAGARQEDLARFEAEARAVAGIEHPNIVRIFEIGEHDALPYFSLEYLSGGSLAKRIEGKPLPVAEAARIAEVLARAMSVAHQRGVVHRDLKPANVLISSDGTLKISDFGLVKRLESDSSQTRTGSILGTPSYMAPEQARGETHEVGPAADQYALGATLYEMLTGRPPFRGASVLDTLDMVRTKEPVAPSQLQPKVPRDIETICLKCLEKDPMRRYADAAVLAEDLRRFQGGEPIVARPISAAERLARWCLRNKRVAVLAAAVALLLSTVAVVSGVAALLVARKNRALETANFALIEANARAEEGRQDAETKRVLAEAAARAANEQNRSAVDAQVELIQLLEGRLRFVPELQDVRREMLAKTAKNLDGAARAMTALRNDIGWDAKDETRNWRSLARAHQRLGELSLSLNQFADAMEQFGHTEAIVERLAADPDNLVAQIGLGKVKRQLGFIALNSLGDTDLGQRYLGKAVEIHRGCLAKQPEADACKSELANSLGQLAASELLLGHLEKARALYAEEVSVRESFSPAAKNELENRRELSGQYERLAELNFRMGAVEEGRRHFDRCAELREDVLAEQPNLWPAVYDRARSFNNSGKMCFPWGHDAAAAREFHRKALDLIEKRAAADPTSLATKAMLAETIYYEAACALHAGDADGAAKGFRRCLEIRRALATDPKFKMPQVDLCVALARCGEHAQAARIAHDLVATPPKDEHLYFQAACGYALAAGSAAGDASLAKQYGAAALDSLRKCIARGWNDVVSLETDPDLAPIRNNPEFQALVAELRRAGATPPVVQPAAKH
jgi:tetratricopeptide (TPR) repeat protein/tRNA A-37 threonylcarbamoyl transferase component Bud32